MKKEDLFEAFGDINSNYIKEAHMKNSRKNSFSWRKWGTIAACLVLLVLCVPLATHLSGVADSEPSVVEMPEIENVNKVESLENGEESVNVNETDTEDKNLEDKEIKELEDTLKEVKHALNQARENEWIVHLLKGLIRFNIKMPEIKYDKSSNDIQGIITGVSLQIQRNIENTERWLLRKWILKECFPEEFKKHKSLKKKKENE